MSPKNRLRKKLKKNTEEAKLERLRREIRELRRENRRLLELYEKSAVDNGGSDADDVFTERSGTNILMSSPSYLSYLTSHVRSSSPYRIWNKVLRYTRRFRFLSTALRMSARIVAVIETSAILLLFASVALVLIPVIAVITLVGILAAIFENKKSRRILTKNISTNTYYIFFPANRAQLKNNTYFMSGLCEISRRENTTVIVVSPSLFTQGKTPFVSSKMLDKNLFIIRRHLYFRLRKTLTENNVKTYLIY